jgi:hypothetical protein
VSFAENHAIRCGGLGVEPYGRTLPFLLKQGSRKSSCGIPSRRDGLSAGTKRGQVANLLQAPAVERLS